MCRPASAPRAAGCLSVRRCKRRLPQPQLGVSAGGVQPSIVARKVKGIWVWLRMSSGGRNLG
eukprot:351873-Chlamydomonas_euryale.AAC.2